MPSLAGTVGRVTVNSSVEDGKILVHPTFTVVPGVYMTVLITGRAVSLSTGTSSIDVIITIPWSVTDDE